MLLRLMNCRLSIYSYLFSKLYLLGDENREVAVFLVDLGAKSDEAQKIDAETHTPHHQLPVAEVVQKRAVVLQQLNSGAQNSKIHAPHAAWRANSTITQKRNQRDKWIISHSSSSVPSTSEMTNIVSGGALYSTLSRLSAKISLCSLWTGCHRDVNGHYYCY